MDYGIPGFSMLAAQLGNSLPAFEYADSLLGLDSGNSPTILSLGDVNFSLNTAVMQSLERESSHQWAETSRIGELSQLQYTGPVQDMLTIPGVIYPEFRGSENVLELLRQMARAGEVYHLIASSGSVLGLYVILSIREGQTVFRPDGAPRKITFSLQLRRFAETAGDTMPSNKRRGLLGGVGQYVHSMTNGSIDTTKTTAWNTISNGENSLTDWINNL